MVLLVGDGSNRRQHQRVTIQSLVDAADCGRLPVGVQRSGSRRLFDPRWVRGSADAPLVLIALPFSFKPRGAITNTFEATRCEAGRLLVLSFGTAWTVAEANAGTLNFIRNSFMQGINMSL